MNLSHPTSLDDLPELARVRLHQMLDRHEPHAAIARQLSKLSGKKISRFAVRRFAANYSAVQADEATARAETKQIAKAISKTGDQVSDLLTASLRESLTLAKAEGRLRRANPFLLEQAERRRRELTLRERTVALAERRVDVIENRFRLDKAKASELMHQLEGMSRRGEPITAEQMQRLRAVYGMQLETDDAANQIFSPELQARARAIHGLD